MSNVKDRLLKEYPANDEDTWKILGEDPNCDFGGSHHEPDLGRVKGRYADVVEYALTLPRFYTWGGGGRIVRVVPPQVIVVPKGFTAESLKNLVEKKAKLQQELAEVEDKIKNLDVDYE